MTLINNDKVKKLGRELCERIRNAFFIRDQLLVESHIDFISGIQFLVLNLRHDFLEGLEVLNHSLVNQDVSVCQVKNLLFATGFNQPVNNLECRKSLTSSRGHHKQTAVFTFRNGFNGTVDSYSLIVARHVGIRVPIVRFVYDLELPGSIAFKLVETLFQLVWRRECVKRNLSFCAC